MSHQTQLSQINTSQKFWKDANRPSVFKVKEASATSEEAGRAEKPTDVRSVQDDDGDETARSSGRVQCAAYRMRRFNPEII